MILRSVSLKNSVKGKLSDFLLPGLMLVDRCWKFSALHLKISGILRRVLYFMYLEDYKELNVWFKTDVGDL